MQNGIKPAIFSSEWKSQRDFENILKGSDPSLRHETGKPPLEEDGVSDNLNGSTTTRALHLRVALSGICYHEYLLSGFSKHFLAPSLVSLAFAL